MKNQYRAIIEMDDGNFYLSKTYDYKNEMYADLEVQGYTEDSDSVRRIEYHELIDGKVSDTWHFGD